MDPIGQHRRRSEACPRVPWLPRWRTFIEPPWARYMLGSECVTGALSRRGAAARAGADGRAWLRLAACWLRPLPAPRPPLVLCWSCGDGIRGTHLEGWRGRRRRRGLRRGWPRFGCGRPRRHAPCSPGIAVGSGCCRGPGFAAAAHAELLADPTIRSPAPRPGSGGCARLAGCPMVMHRIVRERGAGGAGGARTAGGETQFAAMLGVGDDAALRRAGEADVPR